MQDYVVLVSIGLLYVYMQRHNRWSGMLGALEGNYKIPPRKSS